MPPLKKRKICQAVVRAPNAASDETCLFAALPIEITTLIALELDDVRDIRHFAQICRATYNTIESNGQSFWRERFLKTYDPIDRTESSQDSSMAKNLIFRQMYIERQLHLSVVSAPTNDALRYQLLTRPVCQLLVQMLREADFEDFDIDAEPCKNLGAVVAFAKQAHLFHLFAFDARRCWAYKNSIMTAPVRWCSEVQMLQCLIAPLIFQDIRGDRHSAFQHSQVRVYSSSIEAPIVRYNGTIDFDLIAHHINFWKYYTKFERWGPVYQSWQELPSRLRPRYWSSKVTKQGQAIDTLWVGTYAFLEDNSYFHSETLQTQVLTQTHILEDIFPGEDCNDPWQRFRLTYCDAKDHYWPELFAQLLPDAIQPTAPRTRAQGQASQTTQTDFEPLPVTASISGEGADQGEEFNMTGWVEQLADQHGMPGWRRIIMMKYFKDPYTQVVNDDDLWAYEGVIWPGGNMMVGRWWNPQSSEHERHFYRGPFIMWTLPPADMLLG